MMVQVTIENVGHLVVGERGEGDNFDRRGSGWNCAWLGGGLDHVGFPASWIAGNAGAP